MKLQTCCPDCGRVFKVDGTRKPVRGKLIRHNGKTQSLRQWASELGLAHTTISRRLQAGMTPAQALTAPKGTHNGNG